MRKTLQRTFLIACVLVFGAFSLTSDSRVQAQTTEPPYRLVSGITYKKGVDYELKVDICSPRNNSRKKPTLVFFHGGGFRNGARTQGINLLCELMTAAGYQLVAADYRLAPNSVYPAQLDDGQYVIRWLRYNSDKYQVMRGKIVVVGTSAGATLASVIATRDTTRNPNYGLRSISSKPQGAIVLAGVYNFNNESLLGGWDPRGYFLSDRPAYIDAFSAVNHVSSSDGSFLLLHGTEDTTNLPIQSVRMKNKLLANNVPAKLVTFPGIHAGENYTKVEAQLAVMTFLKTYFPIAPE